MGFGNKTRESIILWLKRPLEFQSYRYPFHLGLFVCVLFLTRHFFCVSSFFIKCETQTRPLFLFLLAATTDDLPQQLNGGAFRQARKFSLFWLVKRWQQFFFAAGAIWDTPRICTGFAILGGEVLGTSVIFEQLRYFKITLLKNPPLANSKSKPHSGCFGL